MPKNNPENKTEVKTVFEKVTAATGSYTSIAIHTIIFAVFLLAPVFGWMEKDNALLTLTTIVSLEAIYLALFIQISVNRNTESLESVEEDIQEIQEDVEGIEKDVDEIQVDVDEIQKDVEEIQEDVEEIEKDVDEIQEDSEADEASERARDQEMLVRVEGALEVLMKELSELKKVQNASVEKRKKVVKQSK